MFTEDDERYLLRKLGRNEVVLFVGAGFSSSAINRAGNPLPISGELAALIWSFLEYSGEYDGTSLAEIYEALLSSGKTFQSIRSFLEDHLLCQEVPEWYNALTLPYWYRIFTTNVDDLVERVYLRKRRRFLQIASFPDDDVPERDQFLNSLQAVYLNGRLPCQPDKITFSVRQFARAANRFQPLYDQFARDYATHCTIFVGTQLNEPLFWQHIEARQERTPEAAEFRPKSFLIAPRISPVKRAQLGRFNIVPVEATTQDFLEWLEAHESALPSRLEILRLFEPTLISLIETLGESEGDLPEARDFAAAFHRVPGSLRAPADRSLYLLGASPRWEDLFADLDAPRDVTNTLFDSVLAISPAPPEINLLAVLGSAGSGKSTIIRRLGIRLAQAGRTVFLTNSEALPPGPAIAKALRLFRDQVILLFDNAEVALGRLPEIACSVNTLDLPPVIVLGCRTNDFDRLWGRFPESLALQEFAVPNLVRREIEDIIAILGRNGLLGRLQGMGLDAQVHEFEGPAKRQILVAMREATLGKGFDEIIEDEFDRLTPIETKILYLCVALATEAGYRITKEEIVGCSHVGPAGALHLLMRDLRDIVIATGSRDDLLLLRHRRIAEHVVNVSAPRPLLREAYTRLLRVLSGKVRGRHWRTREFGLYRDLINHKTIYQRFSNDIDEARAIYQSLVEVFRAEPQFWLQYGNLELEGHGGSLEFAENYLAQAESLAPYDPYVRNAKGHLLLRKSITATSSVSALTLRDEGSAILEERIQETSYGDAYAIHIYCFQRFRWETKWHYADDEKQLAEFERLRSILAEACRVHFRHRKLATLRAAVEKSYLQMAIPLEQRTEVSLGED